LKINFKSSNSEYICTNIFVKKNKRNEKKNTSNFVICVQIYQLLRKLRYLLALPPFLSVFATCNKTRVWFFMDQHSRKFKKQKKHISLFKKMKKKVSNFLFYFLIYSWGFCFVSFLLSWVFTFQSWSVFMSLIATYRCKKYYTFIHTYGVFHHMHACWIVVSFIYVFI